MDGLNCGHTLRCPNSACRTSYITLLLLLYNGLLTWNLENLVYKELVDKTSIERALRSKEPTRQTVKCNWE